MSTQNHLRRQQGLRQNLPRVPSELAELSELYLFASAFNHQQHSPRMWNTHQTLYIKITYKETHPTRDSDCFGWEAFKSKWRKKEPPGFIYFRTQASGKTINPDMPTSLGWETQSRWVEHVSGCVWLGMQVRPWVPCLAKGKQYKWSLCCHFKTMLTSRDVAQGYTCLVWVRPWVWTSLLKKNIF